MAVKAVYAGNSNGVVWKLIDREGRFKLRPEMTDHLLASLPLATKLLMLSNELGLKVIEIRMICGQIIMLHKFAEDKADARFRQQAMHRLATYFS